MMQLMTKFPRSPLCNLVVSKGTGGMKMQRNFSSTFFLLTPIQDYDKYLTDTSRLRMPSAIRKLQPFLSEPGMISLGGGMPNPGLFPITGLSFQMTLPPDNTSQKITLSDGDLKGALQYSNTPGIPGLRKQLMDLQGREHGCAGKLAAGDLDMLVTVGSQDGFFRAIEMLVDPKRGDAVFLEDPSYSGALSFLKPYGARLIPMESDHEGLLPSAFEKALQHFEEEKDPTESPRRKVLYLNPTAQNPSGSTLTNERRMQNYALAQKYDVIILEDDPYYFLHPNRDQLHTLLSMDTDGRVIRLDSFSKLISSGIRIGFATGPAPLIEKMNFHVQSTNLHNSGISQVVAQKILEEWGANGFDQHCKQVTDFYCQRRDVLVKAASKYLENVAEFATPEAGMFLWLKLKGVQDSKALIEQKAVQAKILLVPGQSFSPLDNPSSYVRASFSTASDKDMDTAMERLSKILVKS